MAVYTVHVPRDGSDALSRAERTTFVRDGFSVFAFLFGPLYLLRHRAWIAAAAWVVAVIVGGWLCAVLGLPGPARDGLLLLVMLFTGLEASSLRRFSLHRGGLDVASVVGGRTLEEGERAFFAGEAGRSAPSHPTGPARPLRPFGSGVIGSFPEAGA